MFDFSIVTTWFDSFLRQTLGLGDFWSILIECIVVGVLLLVAYAVLAIVLILMERKVCAYFQCRLGPMRVGPWGIFQVFADVLKMLIKEIFVVDKADKLLYCVAPFLVIIASVGTFSFLPWNKGAEVLDFNVGIFLVIRIAGIICTLFNTNIDWMLQYLEFPASPENFLRQPWTLIIYMFVHYDVLHILFNMLWLYWFGKMFLDYLNERQLLGVYLLGGVAGALLFMAAYNIFPYFQNVAPFSTLMGASASVMAIVFAIALIWKDGYVDLFLFGRIKLIYLALFTLFIDLLSITSYNAGGHWAHIGGTLFGVLFALRYTRAGKDLTQPLNRVLDWLVNLGKRRPKMKVSYTNTKRAADYEYNARRKANEDSINTILEKLKRSGYESLSSDEKRQLFDASKK